MSRPVQVTVKQGDLRGLKVKGVGRGPYISFQGIPYAAPPVGDLRFRDPQPPKPWTGVRDAFREGPKCAQMNLFTQKFIGDDDCLYLNVATTSLTGSRPVMVWIHGGGFFYGDGSFETYGPDYIVNSGVIYVGINYRLGVLGFLNLDHEAAPGNMGLKDQVAALKWVKENISQFGGDPNNVTIFGESAGGICVHLLLLSPLAKGLFHKAIMQSGMALIPFILGERTTDVGLHFAIALGQNISDPEKIVEYLRTIPVQRLIEIQEDLWTLEKRADYESMLRPSVDDKSIEPLMPRPPNELMKESSDVPVIIGYNNFEGIYFLSDVFFPLEYRKIACKKISENFASTLPQELAAKSPSKVSKITREIRKFYFGDKQNTNITADQSARYFGDMKLTVGIHRMVEIQCEKNSPTYFYIFSYDSPRSIAKTITQARGKGAMHFEELYYLFSYARIDAFIRNNFGSTELLVRNRLVRMWTNFAKTGNPTPFIDDLITVEWQPATKSAKNFLDIDAKLSAGINPDHDMWKLWNWAYAMNDDQ